MARSCDARNFTTILKLFDKQLLSKLKISSLAPSALAKLKRFIVDGRRAEKQSFVNPGDWRHLRKNVIFVATLKLFDQVLLLDSKFSSLAPSRLAYVRCFLGVGRQKSVFMNAFVWGILTVWIVKKIRNRDLSAILLDHPYSRSENSFARGFGLALHELPTKGTSVRNGVFCVIFVFSDLFHCTRQRGTGMQNTDENFHPLLQMHKFLRSGLGARDV